MVSSRGTGDSEGFERSTGNCNRRRFAERNQLALNQWNSSKFLRRNSTFFNYPPPATSSGELQHVWDAAVMAEVGQKRGRRQRGRRVRPSEERLQTTPLLGEAGKRQVQRLFRDSPTSAEVERIGDDALFVYVRRHWQLMNSAVAHALPEAAFSAPSPCVNSKSSQEKGR